MTDIARKRGDTYADEFVIRNATTMEPLNVTGYTFLLTVDPNKEPTTAATNAYQIVGTILSAPAGRVEFAPSSIQSDRVGVFYFDVQMTDGAGRKRTVDSGKYVYTQDITKA